MMRIYRWPGSPPPRRPRIAAVGGFDGLHIGHTAVVATLCKLARERGWAACLVTFEPTPGQLFASSPPYNLRLTTAAERLVILRSFCMDEVCVVDFARREVRAMTAQAFIGEMLVAWLAARGLVGSASHTMGSDGASWDAVREMADAAGLEVWQVEPVRGTAGRVSSSRIRELLWRGQVAEAAEHLGRDYIIMGEVSRGAAVGTVMGFPTANLLVPDDKLLPATGVYAGWILSDSLEPGPLEVPSLGRAWPAAINIGYCPTRAEQRCRDASARPAVEAHIIGWQGHLDGRRVTLGLTQRLRDERRFPNFEALRRQIEADVQQVREIVESRYLPASSRAS